MAYRSRYFSIVVSLEDIPTDAENTCLRTYNSIAVYISNQHAHLINLLRIQSGSILNFVRLSKHLMY